MKSVYCGFDLAANKFVNYLIGHKHLAGAGLARTPACRCFRFGLGVSQWLRRWDLNPRPSGYEPDELPACSTPRIDYATASRSGQSGTATVPSVGIVLALRCCYATWDFILGYLRCRFYFRRLVELRSRATTVVQEGRSLFGSLATGRNAGLGNVWLGSEELTIWDLYARVSHQRTTI